MSGVSKFRYLPDGQSPFLENERIFVKRQPLFVGLTIGLVSVSVIASCTQTSVQESASGADGWVAITSETILPMRSQDQNNLIDIGDDGRATLILEESPTYTPLLLRGEEGFIFPDGSGLVTVDKNLQVSSRYPVDGATTLTTANSNPPEGRDPVFVFNSPKGDSEKPNLIVRVRNGKVENIRSAGNIVAISSCPNGDLVWASSRPQSDSDPGAEAEGQLHIWNVSGEISSGTPVAFERAPAMNSFILCAEENGSVDHESVTISSGTDNGDPRRQVDTITMSGASEKRFIPPSSDQVLTQAWSTFEGRGYWVTWNGLLESVQFRGEPNFRSEVLPLEGESIVSATFDGGHLNVITTRNDGSGDRTLRSVNLSNPTVIEQKVVLTNWKYQSSLAKLVRGGDSFVAITSIFRKQ